MVQNVTIKAKNSTNYDTLYPITSANQIAEGVLGVGNGGTGQTSLEGLRSALGIDASGLFFCSSYRLHHLTSSGTNSISETVSISSPCSVWLVWCWGVRGVQFNELRGGAGEYALVFVPPGTTTIDIASYYSDSLQTTVVMRVNDVTNTSLILQLQAVANMYGNFGVIAIR